MALSSTALPYSAKGLQISFPALQDRKEKERPDACSGRPEEHTASQGHLTRALLGVTAHEGPDMSRSSALN